MSKDAQAPAAAPAKGKKSMVMAALVILLLGGGGGGAYWWFVARPAASVAAPAAEEAKPAEKPGIVPMEAFVVNLADAGGARYLRVSLSLLVEGEEHAKELEENAVAKMQVRSAILELLALQTAGQLVTAEGKTALKTSIAERASHSAEHLKVTDVLFSEFIVQ